MNYVSVYATVSRPEEARQIGRVLVEEHLVACVNIVDRITSIYRWEGALQEDEESVFFAKTKASLADQAVARIVELHSYECPCVVVLPIEKGNAAYLEWVEGETQ